MSQTTDHLLMIRPSAFFFNTETAESNTFQKRPSLLEGLLGADQTSIHQKAIAEFDATVEMLRQAGVKVTVTEDSPEPHTPDAIFPNNWVSFHQDGKVILYPMHAPNRRLERRLDIITHFQQEGLRVKEIIDMSYFEARHQFLEGSGSMVLDRDNRLAYACLSPRTDTEVLAQFAHHTQFEIVRFHANANGKPIYHTNVLMSLGESYCTICLDAIDDLDERLIVVETLTRTGKQIIEITEEQMNHFAGNMLQVHNTQGERLLVMSDQAYQSLSIAQKLELEKHGGLLHPVLETIEENGGGSARCMMAEVFLPSVS